MWRCRIRKKKQQFESAAAAGGDRISLPETEAKLLVDAERLAEALRHKESELKKQHMMDINAFLLVRSSLPPAMH